MRRRPHPPEVKRKALELHAQGLSNRKIAAILKIPSRTIGDWTKPLAVSSAGQSPGGSVAQPPKGSVAQPPRSPEIASAWPQATKGSPTRRSNCTEEVARRIVQVIKGGNFRTVAARLAGVTPLKLSQWMGRGERGIEPFATLRQMVLDAETQVEAMMVTVIMKSALKTPRDAQWWLTRKHPERWGSKTTTTVEGGTQPLAVTTESADDLRRTIDGELESLERRLSAAGITGVYIGTAGEASEGGSGAA